MKMLSLFSGIGGIDLAASWAGIETVAFCEIDKFCQKVLRKNFGQDIVIFDDVRTLTAESLSRAGIEPESISMVAGGFPCQDISTAGKGEGITGERSGLWFEMLRTIRDINPTWVLAENVPALRTRGIDTVCAGLEEAGYSVWTGVVGAWSINAPHRRNRVFIVAYSGSSTGDTGAERCGRAAWSDFNRRCARAELVNASRDRCPRHQDQQEVEGTLSIEGEPNGASAGVGNSERLSSERWRDAGIMDGSPGENQRDSEQWQRLRDAVDPTSEDGKLADTNSAGRREQRGRESIQPQHAAAQYCRPMRWPARPGERQYEWEASRVIESGMGGSANGISRRVAGYRVPKLKSLGNAVMPQQVYPFMKAIMEYEQQKSVEGEAPIPSCEEGKFDGDDKLETHDGACLILS